MAKRAMKKKKPSKKTTALAKRDKPKESEILATITCNDGKKMTVTEEHIAGTAITPTCIVGKQELNEDQQTTFLLKFAAISAVFRSGSKELQDKVMDTVLGDLVAGAYQDKLVAYTIVPAEDRQNSLDAIKGVQRIRQAADTHLLNIIKAVRDIKRPPVNVVVKQAEQVNVAEQINQGDKQVNKAKNQQSQ